MLVTRLLKRYHPELHGTWQLQAARGWSHAALAQPWTLLRDGPHSLLFRVGGPPGLIVKLIRPRSVPRDSLRKYVHSQARREFRGGQLLSEIGLVTPTPRAWGVALSPLARFESLLVMDELAAFTSGLTIIRRWQDTGLRGQFLNAFATQIADLYGHGYIHKDCHFENICRLSDGRLAWIDTDVRRTTRPSTQRRGLRKTLALLRATARDDVRPGEWRLFTSTLVHRLATHKIGKGLVHEIQ